jgi:hypothetical protein
MYSINGVHESRSSDGAKEIKGPMTQIFQFGFRVQPWREECDFLVPDWEWLRVRGGALEYNSLLIGRSCRLWRAL